jgi:outer membrane immunogenic protein
MRRVLLASIALLSFGIGASVAADLPRSMPVKAPAVVPMAYNWTGFYLGINGGYGWGSSDWSGGIVGSNSPDGWLVGGTVGYNWQALGSPWVFGLEGDIAWTDIRDSFANATCVTGCETRLNWLGTARGRIGYAWDRFMVYGTGGAAFGDIEANVGGLAGTSDTNVGWTAGAGIEGAIGANWTAKVEYLYVDLGSVGCGATSCGVPANVDFTTNVVRGGLNYRF